MYRFILLAALICGSAFTRRASADPAVAATSGEATPQIAWRGVRVNGPFIALTFDDGPDPVLTPQLLDILKARNVRATFFVEGQHVVAFPDLIRREHAEGHEIGNHTWDHPDLSLLDDRVVRSELARTRDAIATVLGKPPQLMRPPYGRLTDAQQLWIYQEFGYLTILWDVKSKDWRHIGPAEVEQQILRNTHAGSIILDHDVQPDTIAAMPDTLDKLLAAGYRFVTVSELLAMHRPDPVP